MAMVAVEVIAALQIEDGLDGDLAVQCALLHDVNEDAGKFYEELEANFGKEVADGVLALTKSSLIQDKSDRMADCLSRIDKQPREIEMVKLADRIVNLQPPPTNWNTEKRSKYRDEAVQIYESLKFCSVVLAGRLAAKIADYKAYINDLCRKLRDWNGNYACTQRPTAIRRPDHAGDQARRIPFAAD